MQYAIGHEFERKSVTPERQFLATALKHGAGEVSAEGILKAAKRSDLIFGERGGRRMTANPLSGVERLNADVDVRHKQRALTGEEFALLLKSARESGIRIQRFNGEQRARIYILSYMTGLRRRELGSLTPRSFDLAGDPPTLTVEAANSKHRKKDVLPLHPEAVKLVREWTKGLEPCDKLFPHLDRRKTWLMVKKDLERVGIPYVNEDGIADFHAAGRHTHITELLRSGATLPEAQKLARHSDIHMTMKYATLASTIRRRPSPTCRLRRCTGTAFQASREGKWWQLVAKRRVPANAKTPARARVLAMIVTRWQRVSKWRIGDLNP